MLLWANFVCFRYDGDGQHVQLTMPIEELEANFSTILKDIETCRGRRTGAFITRCYVLSPPSPEYFIVNADTYVGKTAEDTSSSSSSDDESDDEQEKAEREEEEGSRSRGKVANMQ